MSRGKILVHGTSSKIKSEYGIGYEFKFAKIPQERINFLQEIVDSHFKDLELDQNEYDITETIHLTIPISQVKKTNNFIKNLEDEKIIFGIKSNSLEEAFVKMGEKEHRASSKELKETEKVIEEISKKKYSRRVKSIIYVLFVRRFMLLMKTPIQILILMVMVSYPAFTIHFSLDNIWEEISYDKVYKEIASVVFMGCVSLLCSVFVFLPGYERNNKMRYIMKKIGVSSTIYYLMLFLADLIIGFFMCILCFALIALVLKSSHDIKMGNDFWILTFSNLLWLSTYIVQSKN